MPLYISGSYRLPLAAALILLLSMCKKDTVVQKVIQPNDIIETQPASLLPVIYQVNEVIGGYYMGLPAHYNQTSKYYPAIIFLHGLGQVGDGNADLAYLLTDGIGRALKDKKIPPSFNVDGQNLSFIIFSPQTKSIPTISEIASFYQYVAKTYRIDMSRIYISGLSLGARMSTLIASVYPTAFAAMVPIAGVATNPGFDERCETIALNGLPVWALHNADDPLSDVNDARHFIDLVNSFNPAIPSKMTVFPVYGHDAWTTALDSAYKENGMNIYQWMLQFKR